MSARAIWSIGAPILSILTGGAFLIVAMAIVGLIVGAAAAAPTIVGLVLK